MTICLAILAALPAVLVSHAVYLRFRATFRALEGSRKPLLWAARLGLAGCALPGLLAPLAALWAEAPALAYLAIGLMSATVGALAYPWRQIARKPKPRVSEQLVADMAALAKARIAFHFTDATLSTPTHVEMWIDVLDATGVEWYVICRERHHHEYFLRSGRARSVFVEKAAMLKYAIAPRVEAVLYANNVQKNREMLAAREDLLHVQMLHGDSDKPPSFSPLTRNFDRVFVAGQMGQDRYERNGVFIPAEKFVHVGRPQSSMLSGPREGEIKTAFYMPTWMGFFEDTQFSSLDRAPQIIETFGRVAPGVKLVFKPHPVSFKHPDWPRLDREIRAALEQVQGEYAAPDCSAFDAYEQADLLLTDISSTVIDFLFTGRPQILFKPKGAEIEKDKFPSLEATYQVAPDLSNLADQIQRATGPDDLAKNRNKMRYYAFGDCDPATDRRFAEAIQALIDRQPRVGAKTEGLQGCQNSRRNSPPRRQMGKPKRPNQKRRLPRKRKPLQRKGPMPSLRRQRPPVAR